MNKKEEIKRLEEAVRLAEKGGNFDTIHHDKLAALKGKKNPVKTTKTFTQDTEVNDG